MDGAAVDVPRVMTMSAAGMTETAVTTVPVGARIAALRDVRERLRGMNVTVGRAAPLPGTREEREGITAIPAFPATSPAVVMHSRADMREMQRPVGIPAGL